MTTRRPTHQHRGRARLAAAAIVAAGTLGAPAVASADELGARGFSLAGSGTTLLSYDLTTPGTATSTAITGVAAGDSLVGVAVRPQTADLYAVGVNAATDTVTVYHLGARTGLAVPVGVPGGYVDGSGNPVDLTDTSYGVAFNPSVDRIRLVSAAGRNMRLNPNNGAPVDGDLGGAPGSVSGVNTDGSTNGATTSVDTTAYVNRRQNVTVTTQYTLSAATDSLYIQTPPNVGTQASPVALKLGGAPFDASSVAGLDFKPAVSVTTANAAATGSAYAALVTGGTTRLATVDLTSGEVTLVGQIGDGSALRGLAIQGEEVAGGTPALALSGTTIKRFNTATPGTLGSVNLSAATAGETIVGISRRPQTGQVFGLGVNEVADTATLYVVDPQTGALTAVGTPGSIAFTQTDGVTAIDLPDPATSAYGVDFNPTVDRIRVVTTSGLNLRLNPVTGGAVDSNTAMGTGTNPDGGINGLPGGSTGLSATSYTNAFAQPLTGGVTTQYGLDPASDSLFIQNPPNNGTQTMEKAITVGGAPLDFSQRSGFDIPSTVAVATNATPAAGNAYAALTVAGTPSLFTVDLSSGAAKNLGAIGGASVLESLVIGDPPPAYVPPVVVPPTTPPTTPPVTPPTPDPKPTLSALKLTPTSFRVTKRPKGASTKVKTGTTISFTVSELSTVSFSFERVETGRLSGGTCKKQTSKNRKAKSCQRSVTVGNVKITAPAGKNSVKFTGKLDGGKTLSRASYRITAIAMDTAKQKSDATSARFRVVR